jgi:copper oxidase (laccase) domain-containing protein
MCSLFSCAFSREGRSYGIMTSRRDTYTTEKRFFCYLREGICGDRGRFEGYIEWDS